jgi:esterase/lipase superfamily enzyme
MGNLVVLEALSNYSRTADPLTIGQLIMAAPDIARVQYEQDVEKLSKIVAGMTLYASSKDWALIASRKLAKEPRAGDIVDGIPTIVDHVDTIDVTAVGDEILGLNHDTFATKRPLIDDIFQILRSKVKLAPHDRHPDIHKVPEGEGLPLYWRYVP